MEGKVVAYFVSVCYYAYGGCRMFYLRGPGGLSGGGEPAGSAGGHALPRIRPGAEVFLRGILVFFAATKVH